MMDGSPRRAAMQASKSLASSSRTWFSTGINKTGFFDDLVKVDLLRRIQPAWKDDLDWHALKQEDFLSYNLAGLQARLIR